VTARLGASPRRPALDPGIAHGGHGVIRLVDRIDVGPDDPVHADVEHLFGDPVGLTLVRGDTDDGGDGRREAALGDLAAIQHALQPLLQRPDVIGTVLHLEQRAVVGGAGAGRPIGRRRPDKGNTALFQGLDDPVQTRQLCHGQRLSCFSVLDDFQRERDARP
jgi:hypothetical protein